MVPQPGSSWTRWWCCGQKNKSGGWFESESSLKHNFTFSGPLEAFCNLVGEMSNLPPGFFDKGVRPAPDAASVTLSGREHIIEGFLDSVAVNTASLPPIRNRSVE